MIQFLRDIKGVVAALVVLGIVGISTAAVFQLATPDEEKAFASQIPSDVTTSVSSLETTQRENSPTDDSAAAMIVVPSLVADASLNAWPTTASSTIELEGNAISVTGTGATVRQNVVTISSAGAYTIRGQLLDGQIIIDADKDDDITLILDGATITCSTSAPICVVQAGDVLIFLNEGTANVVEDGVSYVFSDSQVDEPNAAIFSADDLTIDGTGSLTVIGNYNNGIQSKDDLVIAGGNLAVTAVNDGIKGRDSITLRSATVHVNAGSDGLQANNDEDAAKGVVTIESGTLVIVAGADAVQAETTLTVEGGNLSLTSGGGSANSSAVNGAPNSSWGMWPSGSTAIDTPSAKGLKAGVLLSITGGVIDIDSSDDAIHSNDTLTIDAGLIHIASGDDGIHADTSLTINGGDITIEKSYEGIESAAIALNGGTIHLVSSDDGINAAGGNDGSSLGGRPGQNMFNEAANCTLVIRGGYICVNAGGDGLDINGPITMTDGMVIVNGPTDNANGAIDYTGSFLVSGGTLIAAGSSGMAQAPSSTSTQNSVMVNATSMLAAGAIIHIEDAAGTDIVTFQPTKIYQSFVLSSAQLRTGTTYVVYVNGQAIGESVDGVYSSYADQSGTQLGSFTISSSVTSLGSVSRSPGQPGARFP